MNFCPECGSKITISDKSCRSCGIALSANTALGGDYSSQKGYFQREQEISPEPFNVKKFILIAVALLAGYFAITSIIAIPGNNRIRTVQNTPLQLGMQRTNTTYGEVLEGFCTNTSWEAFDANALRRVVEFTGTSRQGDRILIQFTHTGISSDNSPWELVYMEINGRAISGGEATNWFRNALHFTGLS
ncbi:MAG: zinc ribbon domain-containing protein [Defluviitaleaceae bacterium]|nr:zinc ribbon domain-containing protein [Defluviitaleaceae bacterium]